jgi:hypothetical protein
MFILTALNVWQWVALAGSTLAVCATAVSLHRRDRRNVTRASHPAESGGWNSHRWTGR